MAEFTVGAWSLVSARLLAVGTAAYAVAAGFHAARALARRLPDRFSSLGTTLALAVLAAGLWVAGPEVLPAPFGPLLLAILVAGAVFALAYTALHLQKLVDILREALPPIPAPADAETRRKTPHLISGLILLFHAGVGHLLVLGLGLIAAPLPEEWGANLAALRDAPFWASGHVAALGFLLFILFALLPVELIRLRAPDAPFPFKRTILSRLRSREAGQMGGHIHMAAGLATAWLVVAPDHSAWAHTVPAAVALLAVTVFADAASALFGKRWGRRKWFHNRDKSLVGSAAGTLVAFAVCLPLLGAPLAVLGAAVFLLADLVAPIPLAVSDNLLNPLGLAAAFALGQGFIAPLFALP